jgi:glycosyltransferase involved in cell wall biosynthesis
MRIAQVAPLYEAVPPQRYGGTERVVAALTDGLVDRGHDVTLFATGESVTRATLEEVVSAPLRTRMSRQELLDVSPHVHLRLLADLYRRNDFDVIHSHLDIWTLPFAATSATPTVTTLHGRLDLPQVRKVLPMYPHAPLVSISNDQRRPVSDLDLNWMATVPHGLELRSYLRQPRRHGEYLAFVGRVCPEKGVDTAISVARRCGRPLQIAAKVDPMDVDYFESSIEPLLGEDTTFVGEIGEDRKPSFFAGAAATLFPINWPEPFGLVMVESLAAGTPVIALRHGSVPEVLRDGVTGFICDSVDELVEAVGRLDEIDPEECRRHARTFTTDVMCARYEAIYDQLVGPAARLEPARAG